MAANNEDRTEEFIADVRTTDDFSTPTRGPATNQTVQSSGGADGPRRYGEYAYPRGMLIAAFVLGIVGTSLAAIALIVALMGGGVGGGHVGRPMDRASETISEELNVRGNRVDGRVVEEFNSPSDSTGRTARQHRTPGMCIETREESQSS